MKAPIFVFVALLFVACSPKDQAPDPARTLASAEATLASGRFDEGFVKAQRDLAGLCKRGAAPPATALEAFVLRAETGTVLLLAAYLTQAPELQATLKDSFGLTLGDKPREARAFQTVAQNLKELAAVVLRRSGPDSPLALRASRISKLLDTIQTIYYSKQAPLMEALASLESAGALERRLAALGHAVLLETFAAQPGFKPSWKHILAGLLGPVCAKGVEAVGQMLCVPPKDPKVFGECETEVEAIPLDLRQAARLALDRSCQGEGSPLERASGRFIAALQVLAADEALDPRLRAWANATLASDTPKLAKLEMLLPPGGDPKAPVSIHRPPAPLPPAHHDHDCKHHDNHRPGGPVHSGDPKQD